MGSKLLPQALLALPRSISQLPPSNLGFSASISRSVASSNSTSRVVISHSNCNPLVAAAPIRRCSSFVVRADANSEAEADSSGNAEEKGDNVVEEGGEVKAEAEVQVEAETEVKAEAETEIKAEAETEAEAEGETEGEEGLDSGDKVEREKKPRKPRIKLGEIMGILNKKAIEASEEVRPVPDVRTGDVVEIKLEVPENRRRLSVYKGIVISKQNAGIHTTIRIRRIIAGIGVEIVFPLYSPNIKELKVVAHRKVRRARLYYLRDKLPRLSTFK